MELQIAALTIAHRISRARQDRSSSSGWSSSSSSPTFSDVAVALLKHGSLAPVHAADSDDPWPSSGARRCARKVGACASVSGLLCLDGEEPIITDLSSIVACVRARATHPPIRA